MGSFQSASLAFFELRTVSGETVVTSLAFPEMAWIGSSASSMARKMARAVQAHLIDQGRYLEAMRIVAPCDDIEVELPAGPDPLTQPARRVSHVAFLSAGADGDRAIGCVPALGVVALADTAGLQAAVAQAVVLEHRRNGRHADVRKQVAAAWFDHIVLKPMPLDLAFHSAEALRQLQDQRAQPLLQEAACEMQPGRRPATGLDEAVATLARAA